MRQSEWNLLIEHTNRHVNNESGSADSGAGRAYGECNQRGQGDGWGKAAGGGAGLSGTGSGDGASSGAGKANGTGDGDGFFMAGKRDDNGELIFP